VVYFLYKTIINNKSFNGNPFGLFDESCITPITKIDKGKLPEKTGRKAMDLKQAFAMVATLPIFLY
jgi:hypothetical protein